MKCSKKEGFDYVIKQVNVKLMHWKVNQLSFVGRVTLKRVIWKLFHFIL